MNNERIDASVGLTFSLQLFQQYKRSGILQAVMRRIPGTHGICHASIHFMNGVVTTAYIEDQRGYQQVMSTDALIRLNDERGPFEWYFHPQQASPIQQQAPEPVPPSLVHNQDIQAPSFDPVRLAQPTPRQESAWDDAVPRIIATLSQQQFQTWRPLHKHMLYTVWQTIDGRRTIREMKAMISLSPQVVDELLRILLDVQVVSLFYE